MLDSANRKSRRKFLKGILAMPAAGTLSRFSLWAAAKNTRSNPAAQTAQPEPGRIENVYVKFLPGEREALERPPHMVAIHSDGVMAEFEGKQFQLAVGASNNGWYLAAIIPWLN